MQKVITRSLLVFFGLILMLPGVGLAVSANDIVGTWVTEGGKSNVKISAGGGAYSGKLTWLREPLRDGKPKVDAKNENASLRSRPIVGLSLLSGFSFKGDHWEGKIYNPEDGKTYSCQLKLRNAKTLEVRGYVMNPAFGKTQVWTKK